MAFLNTISFPMASDRVSHYSTGVNAVYASIFDTTNNKMVLKVPVGGYTAQYRSIGQRGKVTGLSGELFRKPNLENRIQVEVTSGFIIVRDVIEELLDDAESSGAYYLTVHDGCEIDPADRIQGFTIRQWWLELPPKPRASQANLGTGGENIYDGYAFEFIEKPLRR
ncbi:MAG: hypothetical protein AAGD25_06855 [Cyanobacteria bacterium P01_F01_bin.150]